MRRTFKYILTALLLILSMSLLAGCRNITVKTEQTISGNKEILSNIDLNLYLEASGISDPREIAFDFISSGDKAKFPYKPLPEPVKLVPYKGKVEHIFFHPLIAYPEQAFDGDYMSNGFDDWFVTVDEFNKIIQSLYEKNFILVDINSLYEEVTENGIKVMKRKEIMIPEGKKPLILSVDDLNYNRYMIGNGTCHKLIIGPDGNVATYSIDSDGNEVISYENEVVPILDRFIEKHPDFSLNGAKGILAITGYEGILGYRTDRNSPTKNEEIPEAIKVVNRLKETGWTFASHSYGHPDLTQVTYNRVVDDTTKWRNEVQALVGPTEVYIYPHGSGPKPAEDKFKYLQSQGFKIFCHVGSESYENILKTTNAVITDRRHIDGVSLRHQRSSFLDLYDANDIINLTVRPKR